jgi:hypothetical protein
MSKNSIVLERRAAGLYHAMLNTAAGDEAVIHTILSLKDTLEQQSHPTQ